MPTFGHTGNFIDVDPDLFENLGSYTFVIRTCQTVQGVDRCVDSNEFVLQIADPCGDNRILSAPISTVMVEPILGYETLSLFTEQGAFWPWADEVDANISNSRYGVGLCGPIEYWVTTSDFQPTNIVRFDQATQSLVFEPTYDHNVGIYNLKLNARLVGYAWVSTSEDFQVEVLECQANIVWGGQSITQLDNVWYDVPEYLYLEDYFRDNYSLTRACRYTFGFNIYSVNGINLEPLPIEITYNPTTSVLEYSKCNALSPAGDSECSGIIPYEKNYLIVIEAYLVDAPVYVNNIEANFPVVFLDPCPYDAVSIPPATSIQDFTYFIADGTPETRSATISHRYPWCPITITLYFRDNNGDLLRFPDNNLFNFVSGWTPSTATVSVSTTDKFLHNTPIDLVIEARIDPRVINNVAQDEFRVTAIDACVLTSISPIAQASSYQRLLYYFDATPFVPAGQT